MDKLFILVVGALLSLQVFASPYDVARDSLRATRVIAGDNETQRSAEELLQRDGVEDINGGRRPCPPPGEEVVPLSAAELAEDALTAPESAPDRPVQFFYDLQFAAVASNGQRANVSVPVSRLNFNSILRNRARADGMTVSELLAKSDDELREILRDGTSQTGRERDDAVENALTIVRMSQLSTDAEMYNFLGERMQGASFGKKVGLLASFLDSFADNYDNERIGDGANTGGTVTLTDMMGALNGNLVNGTQIDAGVCRDMHQAAVRMARSMGINEAFGVGYQTHGGGHRTMVLTDPNDRAKVYQLNYGRVAVNDGVAGATALGQNHTLPDVGIRFRVYNGEDRPAIILPSDKGGVLNLVTGGQDRDLDPFYVTPSAVSQAGIETPYGSFRVFYADSTGQGNGEMVTGAAYNIRLDYNDVFYGEYGIAGFYSERDTEAGNLQTAGAYARVTQGFDAAIIRTDDVRVSAYGNLQLRGAIGSAILNGDGEMFTDYNVSTRFGLGFDYRTGPLRHRTSIEAWSFIDQADAIDAADGISLVTPSYLLRHRMSTDLGRGVEGSLDLGLGLRNLGTGTYWQYDAGLGIDSHNTGTSVSVSSQGAISQDMPLWIPGSERIGQFSFAQDIVDEHLRFNVVGQQSFENIMNHQLTFGISGRF